MKMVKSDMLLQNTAETMLDNINKLSNTFSSADIKTLSAATFPGTHCPLMGSLMAVRSLKDALFVVVGTDECTFYTQTLTEMRLFADVAPRFIPIVLDDSDITFGSLPKVKRRLRKLVGNFEYQYVVIVTTCMNELIGDDFDGSISELEEIVQKPVLLVHTEHFSCSNHIPGIEKTWEILVKLMERTNPNRSFNILGDARNNRKHQEMLDLCRLLGVDIGVQFTGAIDIDDIRNAGNANANLVFNKEMLPLAKKMQEKFQQPYFLLASLINPDTAIKEYKKLFEIVGRNIPNIVQQQYVRCKQAEKMLINNHKKATYIYGNGHIDCLTLSAYLCRLGLKPLLLQTNQIKPNEDVYRQEILEYSDPYICQGANLTAMNEIYKILEPDLFIGTEFQGRLQKQGIQVVDTLNLDIGIGFSGIEAFLQKLVLSLKEL